MNILKKSIVYNIRKKGIIKTFGWILNYAEGLYFDYRYKVDTNHRVPLRDLMISDSSREHGSSYQPTLVYPFKILMKELCDFQNNVFVDFGSGKGRALLLASMYNFKAIRGIEFSEELCAIAKKNISIFNRKSAISNIIVFNIDAVIYHIQKDENVFFFFNPFDNIVMEKVILNIENSILQNPRKIVIIYDNPKYKNIIEKNGVFLLQKKINIRDRNYAILTNRF